MKTFLLTVFVSTIVISVQGMYINNNGAERNYPKTTFELLNEKLRTLRDALFARNLLSVQSKGNVQKTPAPLTKNILIDPASKTVAIKSDGKPNIVIKSRSRSGLRLRIRHKPGKRINLVIGSKSREGRPGKRQHVFVRTTGNANIRVLKRDPVQKNDYFMRPASWIQEAGAPAYHVIDTTRKSGHQSVSTLGTTVWSRPTMPSVVPTTAPVTTLPPEEVETEEPEIP